MTRTVMFSLHKSAHLEHETAQTPDVRFGIISILSQDLRWHVQRCLKDELQHLCGTIMNSLRRMYL